MKLIKVINATYLDGYKINLSFSDGSNGIVDLEQELWGEVFEPLKDINLFKDFELDAWTITWKNGADLAPEFLHELLLKTKAVEFQN